MGNLCCLGSTSDSDLDLGVGRGGGGAFSVNLSSKSETRKISCSSPWAEGFLPFPSLHWVFTCALGVTAFAVLTPAT